MDDVRRRPGVPLLPVEIARGLYDAGWHDAVQLRDMVAVILHESGGHPAAVTFRFGGLVEEQKKGTVVLGWSSSGEPVGPLKIVRAVSGIAEDMHGHTTQLLVSSPVVTSFCAGPAQIELPAQEWATKTHSELTDPATAFVSIRRMALGRPVSNPPALWDTYPACLLTQGPAAADAVGAFLHDGL